MNDMNMQPGHYRTTEVEDMTGITYRRLAHWSSNNVLVPSVKRPTGSGSRSVYNDEDVYVAEALKDLTAIASALTLDALRSVAESTRKLIKPVQPAWYPEVLFVNFSSYWRPFAELLLPTDSPCVIIYPHKHHRPSS